MNGYYYIIWTNQSYCMNRYNLAFKKPMHDSIIVERGLCFSFNISIPSENILQKGGGELKGPWRAIIIQLKRKIKGPIRWYHPTFPLCMLRKLMLSQCGRGQISHWHGAQTSYKILDIVFYLSFSFGYLSFFSCSALASSSLCFFFLINCCSSFCLRILMTNDHFSILFH